MASFISEVKKCFVKRQPVFIVLKNVTEIDYDGVTVLLSAVVRFKSQKIRFNGDFPDDPDARRTLEESNFFGYLYRRKFAERKTYSLTSSSSIYTHAKLTVDSELGEQIIKEAAKTVWGESRRCPGVQLTFIELMQNTNNHASLEKQAEKHWWLSVKHLREENRVAFSFVDYGVGVFVSLRNKPSESLFFQVLDKLQDLFRFTDDAEVLKLILHGELHKTASGKPFRGKGLPGIFEKLRQNAISSLAIITNNVYFNSKTNEFTLMKNNFDGTFIYWEISRSNTSLPHGT